MWINLFNVKLPFLCQIAVLPIKHKLIIRISLKSNTLKLIIPNIFCELFRSFGPVVFMLWAKRKVDRF